MKSHSFLRFFLKKYFLSGIFLFCIIAGKAQQPAPLPLLKQVVNATDTFNSRFPVEKLYIQTDKPHYVAGDTIWFKAYLFNAGKLTGSFRSGIFYIELANDSNQVVTRTAFPVIGGLSWGNIPLDTTLFRQGKYTLNAYTNWMLNFGQEYVYSKHFDIAGSLYQSWLGSIQLQHNKERASVHLQLQDMLHQPVKQQQVKLRLVNNKKSILRDTYTTSENGSVDFDFKIPSGNSNNLMLSLSDDSASSHNMNIPLFFHRPQDIDLQFMPEGGSFLSGQPQRIGFKAIGENGKGVQVAGKVVNSHGEEVASFSSFHRGMGIFTMMPQAGETYTAQLSLPGSTQRSYPLPPVKKSGTFLRVNEMPKKDTLLLQLAAVAKDSRTENSFLLIGQSEGTIYYGARVTLSKEGMILKIPTTLFPGGIARFTLMDLKQQPLNERLVFIRHPDNLQIALNTSQPVYSARDSIALHISVTDQQGKPAAGSFSIAVTDDRQVKTNNNAENILNYLRLSSCLNGYIEDPAYYLNSDADSVSQALDNLLLTQGWTGYQWADVLDPEIKPEYEAEPTFAVRGTVLNAFNKPIAGAPLLLVSGRPSLVKDTVTDKQGRFNFTNFPPFDTAEFFIQSRNKRGKAFNVGIELTEFKPPALAPGTFPAELPWNVNMTDTTVLEYVKENTAQQDAIRKAKLAGHLLKEVVVTANKIVHYSQNLNGPGQADVIFNEEDMKKAGKISLLDLLRKRIPGFNVDLGATLGEYDLFFLVDGMALDEFNDSGFSVRDRLSRMSTTDVRGVEIMYSPAYVNIYENRYANPSERTNRIKPRAYVEITTRSGKGLFEQKKPGIYRYSPIPFSWPRKFYRPRYLVKNDTTSSPDYRSTIHWNPDVETDSSGKALVSFYAADQPATYTIIIEGSDMNGHVGYLRKKILIKNDE